MAATGPSPRATRSTSVPLLRRSARLAGEPAGGDWELRYHKDVHWGAVVERKIRWNRYEARSSGDWAYRVDKTSRSKAFYPGKLILAMDTHPQTILNKRLDDKEVAQTDCGPVHAKMRVMVVINNTHNGVLCLPMSTQSSDARLPATRVRELVAVSRGFPAQGLTPWAGRPLHMTIYGGGQYAENSFIDLCQPVHVLAQSRIKDVGYISGGEYARLIRLLTYKENEARRAAFLSYEALYFPNQMWAPDTYQLRPRSAAKAKMSQVTSMRW
ncbi:hypothetical protein KCU95_g2929, partial [Aureobasidium melanogenum]